MIAISMFRPECHWSMRWMQTATGRIGSRHAGHRAALERGAAGFDPSAFSDFGDILGDLFGFGDLFGGGGGNALGCLLPLVASRFGIGGVRLDHPQVGRSLEVDGGRAVGGAKLLEDVLEVGLHGVGGDVEALGDIGDIAGLDGVDVTRSRSGGERPGARSRAPPERPRAWWCWWRTSPSGARSSAV